MALKHISLKSKLIFMLLSIALGCILIIGYQGLNNGKKALTERIYDQLTNVRESKRSQIQGWFGEMQAHVRALAVDHTVVRAMREFSSAYNRLEDSTLNDGELQNLTRYYQSTYLPALQQTMEGAPTLEQYLPSSEAARFLQYHYISNNENPSGEKTKLDQANDRSYYSSIHAYYHPVFREFAENYNFYDMFLVDLESGNIVYSVYKEPDYATSLTTGPYRTSNFGRLFTGIYQTQDPGDVRMSDFAFYRPSNGQPGSFMGTTIFDENNKAIGILAIQLHIARLNSVMTGNQGWREQGLGETGEAFLVGSDYLMRSDVRRLSTAGDSCYADALAESMLMDKTTANKICKLNTSILLQQVENPAISKALSGQSGTQIVKSYTGEKALAAYAPLLLGDMKWAISAQIDLNEANQPILAFQQELGISTVIIASIITFLAMLLAYLFTRPIGQLMEGTRKLSRGETDINIALNRKDEYGELAKTLTSTARLIDGQQDIINHRNEENRNLLLNMLPGKVARQFENGKRDYAERINNVTVLYTAMNGFTDYSNQLEADTAISQLNQLLDAFDRAAEQHGVERVKTVGDSYVAASGLNVSRLDHATRCVTMSMELLYIVQKFNHDHDAGLSIRVGVHSGPVIAGIVGRKQFAYDLWGEAIRVAGRIRYEAAPNSVVISEQTHERLTIPEMFGQNKNIETQGMGTVKIWIHSLSEPVPEPANGGADNPSVSLIQPKAASQKG